MFEGGPWCHLRMGCCAEASASRSFLVSDLQGMALSLRNLGQILQGAADRIVANRQRVYVPGAWSGTGPRIDSATGRRSSPDPIRGSFITPTEQAAWMTATTTASA